MVAFQPPVNCDAPLMVGVASFDCALPEFVDWFGAKPVLETETVTVVLAPFARLVTVTKSVATETDPAKTLTL